MGEHLTRDAAPELAGLDLLSDGGASLLELVRSSARHLPVAPLAHYGDLVEVAARVGVPGPTRQLAAFFAWVLRPDVHYFDPRCAPAWPDPQRAVYARWAAEPVWVGDTSRYHSGGHRVPGAGMGHVRRADVVRCLLCGWVLKHCYSPAPPPADCPGRAALDPMVRGTHITRMADLVGALRDPQDLAPERVDDLHRRLFAVDLKVDLEPPEE